MIDIYLLSKAWDRTIKHRSMADTVIRRPKWLRWYSRYLWQLFAYSARSAEPDASPTCQPRFRRIQD